MFKDRNISPLTELRNTSTHSVNESAITDDDSTDFLSPTSSATSATANNSVPLPTHKSIGVFNIPPTAPSIFEIPCQTISKESPDGISHFAIQDKLVVVMIGLPARGKSYLSNKLVRYLNWLQINAKIFNVGATRRMTSNHGPCRSPLTNETLQPPTPTPVQQTQHRASFFSPTNTKSVEMRELWAKQTLDALLDYLLNDDGCVGVFDATNTTVMRRQTILEEIAIRSQNKLKVLFLESICNDEKIIFKNIMLKLKGPDYKNMNPNVAKDDFIKRMKNYEKVYETISQQEEMNASFQYIQMIDVGRKVISCNINGYIASQIVYYFLNFNLKDRLIFITRNGESYDNLRGRIGGNSKLTPKGLKYAKALEKFVALKKKEFDVRNAIDSHTKLSIITSTLNRSIETGDAFENEIKYEKKQLRLLNELGTGNFDGMTYQEIQEKFPSEFEKRLADKMVYRYPGIGGESYLDVIIRLKPIINEIERSKNHLMIISHRVVCRILMAYFLNLSKDSISELDIPLNAVYMFEPKPFGVLWHLYVYDEREDTFKERVIGPNSQSKSIQQVGISFRERKYSVVPTIDRDH